MNKANKAPAARRAKPPPGAANAKTPALKAPAVKADRHFVTALARGLELLACFRHGDRMLGNQEFARRCGLAKSTVSRLTHTLTELPTRRPTNKEHLLSISSKQVIHAAP